MIAQIISVLSVYISPWRIIISILVSIVLATILLLFGPEVVIITTGLTIITIVVAVILIASAIIFKTLRFICGGGW